MNIHVDRAANQIREARSPTVPSTNFESSRDTLLLEGKVVHTNVWQHIIYDYCDKECKKYMQEKFHWNNDSIVKIDWKAHERAITSLPKFKRLNYWKFLHEWQALGTKRARIEDTTDECPYCKEQENCDHLFECKEHDYSTIRKRMTGQLVKLKTAPL